MPAAAPRVRLLYLFGPTAVGKTAFALDVAERVNADIVSCDSRQLFRGMAIGTAQPTDNERARVRHHLVGVVDPHERMSAGDYARAAIRVLASLAAEGRAALVVGGPGLYADALREGLDDVPKDLDARARLSERWEEGGGDALFAELERVDPVAASKIHPRNRPRVIRALEVWESTGRPLSSFWGRSQGGVPGPVCVLSRARADLYARIDARVEAMFDAGWVDEVTRLLDAGFDADWPAYRSLGYPEVSEVARGRITRAEAVPRIQGQTRRFARRQLTWLAGRVADAPRMDVAGAERVLEGACGAFAEVPLPSDADSQIDS